MHPSKILFVRNAHAPHCCRRARAGAARLFLPCRARPSYARAGRWLDADSRHSRFDSAACWLMVNCRSGTHTSSPGCRCWRHIQPGALYPPTWLFSVFSPQWAMNPDGGLTTYHPGALRQLISTRGASDIHAPRARSSQPSRSASAALCSRTWVTPTASRRRPGCLGFCWWSRSFTIRRAGVGSVWARSSSRCNCWRASRR